MTDTLRALEETLWDAATRYDAAHVEATFHPDFFEFGQSGATWTRATMAVDGGPIEVDLEDYRESLLSPDVALVHYVSRKRDGSGAANRTSLWLRTPDGWRLRFHQGTPVQVVEEGR